MHYVAGLLFPPNATSAFQIHLSYKTCPKIVESFLRIQVLMQRYPFIEHLYCLGILCT